MRLFRHAYLLALMSCAIHLSAQPRDTIHFQKIDTKDGLSNASAMVAYQDSFGFLWIGTRSGLNKYNGHTIIKSEQAINDPLSLKSDYIYDVIQPNGDILLIGTEDGLEIYDYHTNSFSRYPDSRLQNLRVFSFHMDSDSSIWIGSENGLFHVDRKGLKGYHTNPANPNALNSNYCRSVVADSTHVYISTLGGLNVLEKASGIFTNSINNVEPVYHLSGGNNYSILKTSHNELWFGSLDDQNNVTVIRYHLHSKSLNQYRIGDNGLGLFFSVLSLCEYKDQLYLGMNGGGLYLFDRDKDWFHNYTHDPKNPSSLSDIDVWGIYWDRTDNLWICTDGGGVNQHHSLFNRFHLEQHNPYVPTSLGVNDTHDFYQDNKYLWVGNNTLGLSRLNLTTGHFHNFPFTEDKERSLLDYTVLAVEGDEKGNLWVGSYEGGLSKLNIKEGTFSHIINQGDQQPLPSNYIGEIKERNGVIWLGTSHGLAVYDHELDTITSFRRIPPGATNFSDDINALAFESDSILWVGSSLGLFSLNIKTNQLDSTNTVLDSMMINDLAVSASHLWIATATGLGQYTKSGQLKWYTRAEGLSHNNVVGVVLDDQNRVWCITTNGLNLFDTNNEQFYNFYLEDGLQGNQFNLASIYKSQTGKIYAGGLKGYNSWQPKDFQIHTNLPKVVFTDYQLQHEDLVITKNLLHSAEITLENTDNHVTINYFSDEILNAKKTSFAYRIREINSGKWIEVNDWKIQFIDLSDGQYTLDVKAKNFDGIWGNHSSIQLKVLPSPWATSYAYAGYFLCFIVLFIGRDQYLKNLKRKLENIVEARTSEITTQKELAEKDKAKIGEQRDLISKSLKERESLLKEIHHRVKNNLQIIASLLYMQSGKFENEDFKRVLEEGQGRVRSMALIHQKLYENSNLKNIPFDEYLWELIREVQASYGTQQSKIALEIEAHNIHFDVETAVPLGLIVNEMATNAFKYAFVGQQNGVFSIVLTEENGEYTMTIKDDGVGSSSKINIEKARSLGLRLIRMLSQQLEGEFEYTNETGTCFRLTFTA